MMNAAHSPLSALYFTLLLGLTISPYSQAEDGWNVDGEHGQLHVYGTLGEGACRLGMRSEFQQVVMDSSALGAMKKPGDLGKPANLILRLYDCQRTGGEETDRRRGTVMWDAIQPVITISFESVRDPDNPSLLFMKGIHGAGLIIRDTKGRQVRPGERGQPQFVAPGSNQLVYTITPVRTKGPLIAGAFRTVVDFKVSYD
ncbi:MAG: fimbrial protein [Silvania sp.]